MGNDTEPVEFPFEPLGGEPSGESNSLMSFVEAEMEEAFDDELDSDLYDASPVGIQDGIKNRLLKAFKMDPRTMVHEQTNQKVNDIAQFMQGDLGLNDPADTIHAIIKLANVSRIDGPNADNVLDGIHRYVRSTWEMKKFKEERDKGAGLWRLDQQR